MKSKLIMAGVLLSLGACATGPAKVDLVSEETLDTNFVSENIKVVSKNCGIKGKILGLRCEIVSIESTGTSPSNGGSNTNRKDAFEKACSYAIQNIAHWKSEKVQSSRTVERVGTAKEASESTATESSDRQVGRGESSNRQNSNDSTVVITNTIRRSSETFLQGWSKLREEVDGKQEVSCTMRWSSADVILKNQTFGL